MTKGNKYTRREVISNMAVAVAVVASGAITLPTEVSAQSSQQGWRVLKYSFGWNHHQNLGRILLYLENYNQNPVRIDVASAEEFAALVAILKEDHVYWNSSEWLHTGNEPI